jgi:hypothetical protein
MCPVRFVTYVSGRSTDLRTMGVGWPLGPKVARILSFEPMMRMAVSDTMIASTIALR